MTKSNFFFFFFCFEYFFPTKVPGNDINEFLKQEGSVLDFADSSDLVMPNICSQGGWVSSPQLPHSYSGSLSPRNVPLRSSSQRFRRASGGPGCSVDLLESPGRLSPYGRSTSRNPPPPLWMYSPLIVQSLPSHQRPHRLSISSQSLQAGSIYSAPDPSHHRSSRHHLRRHNRRDQQPHHFEQFLTVDKIISPS